MSNLSFKINGTAINPPLKWRETQIIATFDFENNEASINTSQIIFVDEAAKFLRDYVAGGVTGTTPGIMEGPTLTVDIQDPTQAIATSFDFIIDTAAEDFEIVNPTTVRARLRKVEGVRTFQERAKGTTFLLLLDKGAINTSDFKSLPYVVEKEPNGIDLALLSFSTTMMVIQLIQEIRVLQTNIQNIISTAQALPTGPVSAVIQAIALAIIQAVFVALLIAQVIKMVTDLIAYLISPVKFHKVMKVRTMLEKGANFLGYQYDTSISVLDDLYYLPSKVDLDLDTIFDKIKQGFTLNQPGIGIPSERDSIYTLGDLFTMCNRDLFNARLAIKNNTVEQHALNAPWWTQLSTYQMPDRLQESTRYNASELESNRLIKFQVDQNDYHTIDNYTGTAYEIITEQVSQNNLQNVLLKGLEVTEIAAALPNRKSSLNATERALKELAGAVDDLTGNTGSNNSLASRIQARVGMLKMEKDLVRVGKLMRLNNQLKLAANQRDNFSAKFLYNNYHNEKSFVLNNYGNQYRTFEGQRIIFGYSQFLELVNNNYLTTQNGNSGKITKFAWTIDQDTAITDFRVKQIWTTNLSERTIET